MCQNLGSAQWKAHEFQCGPKTGWDDQIKTCNWLRHIKNKNKACNGNNCTLFIMKDLHKVKTYIASIEGLNQFKCFNNPKIIPNWIYSLLI